MTKRIALWSLAAACLALAVFAPRSASGGQAQGCGLQTLKGSYAFRMEGWWPGQAPGAPARVPVALVGTMTFDGWGGGTITNTGVNDGFVFRFTVPGLYTVEQDCTGTLIGPDGKVGSEIAIAENGKSVFVIGVGGVPNATLSGEMRKQ